MSKRLINGLWKAEKEKIYGSLPRKKMSLESLLETPTFTIRNNQISEVNRIDLDYLCEILPSSLWGELYLPLIFQKRKQLYILLGAQLEKWIVEKILDLTTTSPLLLDIFTPRHDYFVYHYQRVQKTIPTLVFLTFAIDSQR
ncbi:hypothetical protein CEE45_04305 [Candidatus Heimdallarchaeota archaeon B3_Heim]|nr:MAG: hypothetical protein CEE45_04305 [Candidatus Heimdallarchaeota archaeon B3_Heim]